MSGFEKKPCPKCGKEVSTHPRWWKEHEAKCETEADVQEPEKKEQDEVIAEPKTESKAQGLPPKEIWEKMSAEDRTRIEKALKRQEANRTAPNLVASSVSSDEHMELRKRYCPETIPEHDERGKVVKPAERHAFVADGKNIDFYTNKGYIPCVNEHGQMVKTGHGDILCTLDMETHNAIQEALEKENSRRDRRKAAMAAKAKAAGANGDGASFEMEVSEQKVNG